MPKNQSRGFALISLILAIVIIAILFGMYYQNSGEKGSPAKTGQEAIEQTKRNNQLQIEQQIEIQNQINSINN
ncbi:MAG: prepilin-type N-terminal cleavage/methylation domain-containing protein [Candidatus Doudnabacteria bacterium]|nr:prepilin-type N-terminal cleavage/methylation domain-containing protein [Candidatus Doudnabacteria bacterium]